MASIYPSEKLRQEWKKSWYLRVRLQRRNFEWFGREEEFLSRKAAEHAARVCLEIAGQSFAPHVIQSNILALIDQGKEGGV